MIGVKDQNDRRDSWHHGGWTANARRSHNNLWHSIKVWSRFIFIGPSDHILLDATHSWNDAWVAKDEQKWYYALLAISVVCYIIAFTLSGILFIWFNPSGQDCGLNVFFLVMTMILAFAFAVIALHPQVNGSLLPASLISVYCAYVCYTGLSFEPQDYVCNGLHNKSVVTTSTLLLGMLTTVLLVLYSALRAGSSTTFLSPPSSPKSGGKKPLLDSELEEGKEKTDETESRPVSYSYTFFHFIYCCFGPVWMPNCEA
ncbi:hypothetical protein ACSBR2_013426 [Camellia fascicularis]